MALGNLIRRLVTRYHQNLFAVCILQFFTFGADAGHSILDTRRPIQGLETLGGSSRYRVSRIQYRESKNQHRASRIECKLFLY